MSSTAANYPNFNIIVTYLSNDPDYGGDIEMESYGAYGSVEEVKAFFDKSKEAGFVIPGSERYWVEVKP